VQRVNSLGSSQCLRLLCSRIGGGDDGGKNGDLDSLLNGTSPRISSDQGLQNRRHQRKHKSKKEAGIVKFESLNPNEPESSGPSLEPQAATDTVKLTEDQIARAEKVRSRLQSLVGKASNDTNSPAYVPTRVTAEQLQTAEKAKHDIDAVLRQLDELFQGDSARSPPPKKDSLLPLARAQKPSTRSEQEEMLERRFHGMDIQTVETIRSVEEEIGGGAAMQLELLDALSRVHDTALDINQVISTAKIQDDRPSTTELSKIDPVVYDLPEDVERVKICGYTPLNIFTPQEDIELFYAPQLETPTWSRLVAVELLHSKNFNPKNAYEELAQWTDHSKIWTFPINNEIGLVEEESTGFHEHIFLERHLSDWCPRVGPIRQFMELVCVGLSKNPYISAPRKRAVIEWYREFFEEKKVMLEEIGAYPKKRNAKNL